MSAARSFFRDEDGTLVVFQPPNPPLLGWLAFRIAALVWADGTVHAGLSFLSQASLFTWAYLEISAGSAPFRRVLGAAVMAGLVVSAFR